MRSPAALGVASALLIAVGSYGAGATRYRGGVMRTLGLGQLLYGHGRSIMDALLTLGILGLVVAWVWGLREVRRGAGSFSTLTRTTWAWATPLALSGAILSRDVYSYLMQGAMVRDGFNPYSEGAAVNPGPYLLEVSHDWRNTTTPYGPLHLWIGHIITRIVGDNVTAGVVAYRLLSIAGFALIVAAVPRIARAVGGNPTLALWIGCANPVMLLHLIGGMHNEALMVGLVSVGLLGCLRGRYALPGIALIGLAVALKATAAVALPFVVWILFRRFCGLDSSWPRRAWVFLASGAGTVAIAVGVVAAVTVASGSSWGWVEEISGNSKVVNPLAGPTLIATIVTPFAQLFDPHFTFNEALGPARTAGTVFMLCGLTASWIFFRPRLRLSTADGNRRAMAGIATAYATAFVFNAVTLPWYYASILSLLGTFRPSALLQKAAVAASVIVALAFTGGGNHRLGDNWFLLVAGVCAWVAAAWSGPQADRDRAGAETA